MTSRPLAPSAILKPISLRALTDDESGHAVESDRCEDERDDGEEVPLPSPGPEARRYALQSVGDETDIQLCAWIEWLKGRAH